MEHFSDNHIDDSIATRENDGEIVFYFHPKCFCPDKEELLGTINGLIYGGSCSGGDIARFKSGEVRIFFNPVLHCPRDHMNVVTKITETIRSFNPKTIIS